MVVSRATDANVKRSTPSSDKLSLDPGSEKPRVPASIEVADEVAESMLELDVPAVRAPVVDD